MASSSAEPVQLGRRDSQLGERRDSRSLRHRMTGRPAHEPPKDTTGSLLIAGAAAGGISKFCTAPIDRVKLMYQVSPDRAFSVSAGLRTARKIIQKDGITALWRGNSVAVLRDVPYAAIIFSSYAMIEEIVCGCTQRRPDVWSRSAAGCAAGAIATCATYPLDVLRARFGAEWGSQPRYGSYYQGVREILRKEGGAALFAGIRPTLLGIMPYSALSFAAFETLKAALLSWNAQRHAEQVMQQRLQARLSSSSMGSGGGMSSCGGSGSGSSSSSADSSSGSSAGSSSGSSGSSGSSIVPSSSLGSDKASSSSSRLGSYLTSSCPPADPIELSIKQKLAAGGTAGLFAQVRSPPIAYDLQLTSMTFHWPSTRRGSSRKHVPSMTFHGLPLTVHDLPLTFH